MKAWVYDQYGPPEVLELRDVAKPAPGDGEILVKTYATTVTAGDWRLRSLDVPTGFGIISRLLFGVFKPRKRILGTELAGEVEAVGKGVTRFAVGDPVVLFDDSGMGCYAEYKCLAADRPVAHKPANLTWDEAAALAFGGTTALHFLEKGEVQRGERVLINGASGGVGTAAVQLAKHFGAEVTGVCSAANVALVKSLGADHVIDYKAEDFTQSGERYDVIVDTAGTAPFARSKRALTERGRLLLINGNLPAMLQVPWVALTNKKKLIAGVAVASTEHLRLLVELAEAGEYKPFIDRRYPFEQMVDAHRYVDTGRKRGNVVVTLEGDAADQAES